MGEIVQVTAARLDFLAPLHSLDLSPELLVYLFLPTLLFDAAFTMDTR